MITILCFVAFLWIVCNISITHIKAACGKMTKFPEGTIGYCIFERPMLEDKKKEPIYTIPQRAREWSRQ